ncbi:MAG: hypothetical protein IJ438_00420 [Clostridia bacterium]|nr:hypothetical protein [Clostridia bacterium]
MSSGFFEIKLWYHRHTHVLVSDPTQGYGLYIDWMIQEAGAH